MGNAKKVILVILEAATWNIRFVAVFAVNIVLLNCGNVAVTTHGILVACTLRHTSVESTRVDPGCNPQLTTLKCHVLPSTLSRESAESATFPIVMI